MLHRSTSGGALTAVALSATLHCLTGCAIGEVLGIVIGTALGFSDLQTIALAVALAFLFGYTLTSLPLLRAGFPIAAVTPIALASDTASIAVMEIVDNAIMLVVPGAMEAGLDNVLFWGALSVALVVAGAFALPLNRWLIARGKGHAVVHETGIHGGPRRSWSAPSRRWRPCSAPSCWWASWSRPTARAWATAATWPPSARTAVTARRPAATPRRLRRTRCAVRLRAQAG
jgi:Domain of unknown function (DUF4396)